MAHKIKVKRHEHKLCWVTWDFPQLFPVFALLFRVFSIGEEIAGVSVAADFLLRRHLCSSIKTTEWAFVAVVFFFSSSSVPRFAAESLRKMVQQLSKCGGKESPLLKGGHPPAGKLFVSLSRVLQFFFFYLFVFWVFFFLIIIVYYFIRFA